MPPQSIWSGRFRNFFRGPLFKCCHDFCSFRHPVCLFNVLTMPNQRLNVVAPELKITVIIPVLNESQTISSVVAFARRSPLVDEIIVVDDGSIDGTPELAVEAGAR